MRSLVYQHNSRADLKEIIKTWHYYSKTRSPYGYAWSFVGGGLGFKLQGKATNKLTY